MAAIGHRTIRRDWNAFRWLGFEQALWDAAVESAKAQSLEEPLADVYAFDIDASAMTVFVAMLVVRCPTPHLRVQPHFFSAPTETGMMVTNPPYGERIGSHAHVAGVYQNWVLDYRTCPTGNATYSVHQ